MGFFGGMPLPAQFFLAFIIVFGLLGALLWAIKRFGAGRLGGGGLRGRQPRLAVIDYASVDGRRRLILVRRDNVEHLVMIGGPVDVVVEANIVRAAPASRDLAVPRQPAIESAPRAIPLPENAANGGWPLQPEPAAASAPARMPRGEHAAEEPWPLQPPAEARPRPPRDTLAALADELSPPPAPPPPPPRNRPQPSARPQAVEPRQETRQESRPEPRMPASQPAPAKQATSLDQQLAGLANDVQAMLRKPRADRAEPNTATAPRAAASLPQAEPATSGDEPREAAPNPTPAAAAPRTRPIETKPARTEANQQPNAGKAVFDSIEQEMANLLGRTTAKK